MIIVKINLLLFREHRRNQLDSNRLAVFEFGLSKDALDKDDLFSGEERMGRVL